MSEIPADVKALALAALKEAGHGDINNVDLVLDEAIEIISGAILAERERCAEVADSYAKTHDSRVGDWIAAEIRGDQ